MKDETTKEILRHVQTLTVMADVMQIEIQQRMIDHKFKSPSINNHVRRIKESLERVKIELTFLANPIDRDHLQYAHATEIYRLFKYFATMSTDQLSEIMDAYEQFDKENPPTESFTEALKS